VSIQVALNHVTSYRYDRLVSLSPQVVRLRPAPHCRTRILSYSLRVQPSEHFINWQQDPHSNYLARLTFPNKVSELRIEVDLIAELAVYNPFDFFLEPQSERLPVSYEAWQAHELQPFRRTEPLTPRFERYLAGLGDLRGQRTIDALVDLTKALQRDIRYLIRLEPGVQTVEETLDVRSGSCRDTAWLLVQLARHMGLAARFASGYLIQLVADTRPLDGPAGPDGDFTDLHAWCEVYLPGAGWVGLDPTSGLLAGEGHIPLSCTPDPASSAPVAGTVDDCEVEFEHSMSVRRLYESPRVTKPYTDQIWKAILTAGRTVDEELRRLDVRLTMGGEPTFVSVDDRDGDEWHTQALGPTKRHLAADLLARLRCHFAAGGVLHFGQGKRYPGEQLPRWALSCYWRRDGQPIWTDPSLLADERRDYAIPTSTADRFVRDLAARLGVTDQYVQAGFEDTWFFLWRERRLPTNVDPFDAKLGDELERERLQRVFERGLDAVVGYALPLVADAGVQHPWRTGPWFLRSGRMYLAPGDSPMGYRLPLDSLPWVSEGDYPYLREYDPMTPLPPLPDFETLRGRSPVRQEPGHDREPVRGESAHWIVRTALCTEVRRGVLHVFLPPMPSADEYLALVAVIERTAADLETPVVLEGYPPPLDARLQHIDITPDPGVVEANLHPASSWEELVEQTTVLYDAARESHLTTEKFLLDGRHVGTGGGNHFVLGGSTPADSPFLRRPDLLRSLIAYWHNHPSLSYLFSGLFLGPSSQAPRVDEARHDSLYELEIAFRQIPERDRAVSPWLVDRIFRNLLADMTGNTHRAEFCIDKLYSPESSSGRNGLLELRAFEMPPHPRMSLAQQLLVRAFVARFWGDPYEAPLVRWGTELQDRFMLPFFVQLDFEDVLSDMSRAGIAIDRSWFAPHFEFRFPIYGDLSAHGMNLSLRQALEPWHVLGEEGAIVGTVRYVDSSVERLQVLVTGLTPGRFVVTCNGRPVPLQPTGRNGEYVAGVRYRAWQPPSALHPMIPVHAPLTFDLVDNWLERSFGGCQYHVMHPGGRSYDQLPVNGFEAESRRLSRFLKLGHTPGRIAVPPARRSLEFPYTLDLRT
jgi:uncharacterized protein (DUF2126 family)/transglutaminase-like putative cysteine protease